MLPVIAYNLLHCERLLANAARLLADKVVAGLTINEDAVTQALAYNPILATALNPAIGYERSAAIAKKAAKEGRRVIEVAAELSGLDREVLEELLDPGRLASGGVRRSKD